LMAGGGGEEVGRDGVAEGPSGPSRCEHRRCGHPRFLIVKRDAVGANVLVLGFPDGRTALPVFGLEEEAGMFLWLETAGDGWRVAEISEADLAALLRGSCARVRSVVHPFAEEGIGRGPATVSREDFLGALSGERGRRVREPAHGFEPRNPAGKEGDFW
jgi:hypothetical protein